MINRKAITAMWLVGFGISLSSFVRSLLFGYFDVERLNTTLLIGVIVMQHKQLIDLEKLQKESISGNKKTKGGSMKIWELIKKLLGKKEEPEMDIVTRQVVIENGHVKEVVYHNRVGSYYIVGDVVGDEVKKKLMEVTR